jgi:hypothetical protein
MVAGEYLNLNNIEHGILRPTWQDPRIHFAINCASFGCPNVQARAFTGANLEFLLDEAARQYLSHPRTAHFDGTELVLSSIFKWYAGDFGNNTAEVLQHISTYAPAVMAERLKSYNGEIRFEYDWKLNGY